MAKRYSPQDIAFIKANYHTKGCHYCAAHLGRHYQGVIFKANSLGLYQSIEQRRALAVKAREKPLDWYKVDPRPFFDIQSPEVAYFLGYFWADGHVGVYKTKRHLTGVYSFSLEVQRDDYLVIKPVIDSLGKWSVSKRKRGRYKPVVVVRTGNKPLFTFLMEQDYGRKSEAAPTKILSRIPDHLKHYWWRGYFDGDGHIGKKRNEVVLAGAFEQDWSEHQGLLNRLDITHRVEQVVKDGSRSAHIRFHGFDAVTKWGDYIYQGQPSDRIGLLRKYSRWVSVKEGMDTILAHDALVVPKGRFSIEAVYRLIAAHDGKLSRRKLAEAFGVDKSRVDRATQRLRAEKRIRAKGRLAYRRFFVK